MNKGEDGNTTSQGRLAKLLRVEQDRDDFEFAWGELERKGVVEDWEMGRTTREDVLEDAKDHMGMYHRAVRRNSSLAPRSVKQEEAAVQKVPVEPTEHEADATDAFRKYLAAHAARQPLVRTFRSEHLPGGRLLRRDDEIEAVLLVTLGVESDLDQYLHSHRGKSSNVLPFRLHDGPSGGDGPVITNEDMAQIIAEEQSEQERRLDARWVPPGTTSTHISEEEESEPDRYLEELGQWLVGVYPWLHVGDAVVFAVSGRPPRLAEPLSAAMDMGHATYSITFSPWVSEETVLRTYRTIMSRHRRLPGEKTLRVLRFVSEQADEDGCLPAWPKLLDQWNAANPDERFSPVSGRGALQKAYERAVKALVPPYLPLGPER